MTFYSDDGSINVTVVDGSTPVGAQSVDGGLNVFIVDGTAPVGLYHASGAKNVIPTDVDVHGVIHPSGAMYVTTSGAKGAVKVSGLSSFPSAANTGVPAGTSLTIKQGVDLGEFGQYQTTSDGQILENLDVRGKIVIAHNNVIVRKCKAWNILDSGIWNGNGTSPSGWTVEDCTVDPTGGTDINNSCIGMWGSSNVLIQRCNISNNENGIWVQGNGVTIKDNYFHDFIPYVPLNDPHIDGIQIPNEILDDITIEHNNIALADDVSSAITTGTLNTNVVINNNRLSAGNIAVYLYPTTATLTNNEFLVGGVYIDAGTYTISGNYGPSYDGPA